MILPWLQFHINFTSFAESLYVVEGRGITVRMHVHVQTEKDSYRTLGLTSLPPPFVFVLNWAP